MVTILSLFCCISLVLIASGSVSYQPRGRTMINFKREAALTTNPSLVTTNKASHTISLRGGETTSLFVTLIPSFMKKLFNAVGQTVRPYLPKALQKYVGIIGTGKSSGKDSSRRYGKKRTDKLASSSTLSKSTNNDRIVKELQAFIKDPPDNCRLIVNNKLRSWEIELTGVNGTIYAGEKYRLRMNFPKDYPARPPSVFFLKPCPKHVHVYTNGDICLNFLGKDWRPTMTAQMLAASILSMLSSAREKKIPQDNALHSDSSPGQQQNWMYHDDRC